MPFLLGVTRQSRCVSVSCHARTGASRTVSRARAKIDDGAGFCDMYMGMVTITCFAGFYLLDELVRLCLHASCPARTLRVHVMHNWYTYYTVVTTVQISVNFAA
ncbi:hypothetical protein VPH35_071394 [Triticum aestivum]